jgi:hypothetical protein
VLHKDLDTEGALSSQDRWPDWIVDHFSGGQNCPGATKAALTNPDGRQSQATRTFGKFLANRFFGGGSVKGKSENRHVSIGDLMVGLGGLEPPTSPLSGYQGLLWCYMHSIMRLPAKQAA